MLTATGSFKNPTALAAALLLALTLHLVLLDPAAAETAWSVLTPVLQGIGALWLSYSVLKTPRTFLPSRHAYDFES